MLKHKLKASFIHFLISLALVTLVVGGMLLIFFPNLYIGVTDFKEIFYIILSVDLILGPLLTFTVFNPNKTKSALTIDFSIVSAVQLTALIYGAFALYQIHPVYITFNVDRFTIVSAKDAEPEKAIFDEFNVSKLTTAKLAFAKMPTERTALNDLIINVALGGSDLDQREEYYVPYEENTNEVIAKGLSKEGLLSQSSSNPEIKSFFDQYGNDIDNFVFLPINSDKKEAIIVLDKQTANPVHTIHVDPWNLSLK